MGKTFLRDKIDVQLDRPASVQDAAFKTIIRRLRAIK